MQRSFLLTALVVLGSLPGVVPRANADVSVGVNFFYDDLAPHGDWFEMDDYGWVWTPRHVAADWRPYTRGRWVLSDDDGWLWLSDEDFGWATCHYGRWFYDARRGWVWVPGREWAPAWVSWRTGGGYVGWAPLPPEYRWQAGVGLSAGNFDLDLHIGPSQYVFVPERHFFDSGIYRQALPYARNGTFVNVTRNVTRYDSVGGRVVDRGISVGEVERASGRRVPRYRVEDDGTAAARRRPVVERDRVRIFRPTAKQIEQAPAPRAARPRADALARVKAQRAEPPADPKAAGHARAPAASAPREDVARRDAARQQQAQRKQQQQQARERQLAGQRQREQEQARRKQQATERQSAQQRQGLERRAEQQRRVLQQNQARQQADQRKRQQEAQRREVRQQAQRRQAEQQRAAPRQGQERQQARRQDAERPRAQQQQQVQQRPPQEQQQARQRAQQQRTQQARERQHAQAPKKQKLPEARQADTRRRPNTPPS